MKFKKLKETREKREPQKTCTNISRKLRKHVLITQRLFKKTHRTISKEYA